jgi:hypothetical protein
MFDSLGFYFKKPKLMIDFFNDNHSNDDDDDDYDDDYGGSNSNVDSLSSSSRSSYDDLLIYRPLRYYRSIYNHLHNSYQSSSSTPTKGSMDLQHIITMKTINHTTIALIPQHLPKFHPSFDEIILSILIHSPNTIITIIG